MSALTRHSEMIFAPVRWQPEVMALLDEEHLVTWSADAARRTRFAASLQQFLGAQRDTDVCNFYGRYIDGLEAFCHQLERQIPCERLDRRVDGTHGVTSAMRVRPEGPMSGVSRLRYVVWHDADVLLASDEALFGRLVDALVGVSAEAEYVSEDLLLIQRCVFLGGDRLQQYAMDPKGQFNVWLPDGSGDPFWRIVTGLDSPPVVRVPMDSLT